MSNLNFKSVSVFLLIMCLNNLAYSQSSPDLFVNDWKAKSIQNPSGINTVQTTNVPTVIVTINTTDTIQKVSKYLFGGNLNPYSPLFKKDSVSLRHLKNMKTSVLRWPGGNLSNDYFWNAKTAADFPDDLPGTKYWKGSDPTTKDVTTPDYYKTLKETNSTGCICVNYSYARYGKSDNSVQRAAHLAADWVRYDKGRTRFWEIGNENFGNWQSGYEIDPTKYTDGRPKFISGDIYGAHCKVFIDSMRVAAAEVGAEIYIGVQAWEDYTSWDPIQTKWNDGVFAQVGNKADFIIIHNYYTPYQTNSSIPIIWKSLENTPRFVKVIDSMVKKYALKPMPLALTEYNMQGQDSAQTISYINGMHATMVIGDAMKYGFGMAERWSTVGFWGGVGDLGTFSYAGEPNVPEGSMRPEFYYYYYLQKTIGDVMVKSTSSASDIVSYATTFSSGQSGIVLLNKGKTAKTVKVKLDNFKPGTKYHRYLLTGGTDNGSFSGNVYVNGQGSAYIKGGPAATYDKIKPLSTDINGDITVDLPRYGTIFLIVDGEKRPEYQSARIESDGTKLQLALNMPVSASVTSSGFSVKANGSENIDVLDVQRNGSDPKLLTLVLSRSITTIDELTLSYYNGAIATDDGQLLINFENKKVDNLLKGSALLPKLAQTKNENSVLVSFNKNLNEATFQNLKLSLSGTPAKIIVIQSASFSEGDSSQLILNFSDQLQSFNQLKLNYSGTNIISTDGGLLKPFELAVSNLITPKTPKLLSSELSATGYDIYMTFDQLMADAHFQQTFFKVKVNGVEVPIKSTLTISNKLNISLFQAINSGEMVTVSYADGEWTSFAGEKVSEIIDYVVPNKLLPIQAISVPGTIEAENFTVNTGTQTENTSDTGGGRNIGYIDSGDWLEYLINVENSGKYTMTFRVAANTAAGQIDVSAPGQAIEKIGTVSIPVTGGWQTWVSVATSVNLVAGKQRLRIYFAKGGCNFNWVKVEKDTSVSVSDLTRNKELIVFPNPASSQISIQSPDAKISGVEIFDLVGKRIYSQKLSESNSATIYLPAMINGCYNLVVITPNQKFTKLLIVNHVNN
jgi:uncharacterized repeat protein (TIGR02059 family)